MLPRNQQVLYPKDFSMFENVKLNLNISIKCCHWRPLPKMLNKLDLTENLLHVNDYTFLKNASRCVSCYYRYEKHSYQSCSRNSELCSVKKVIKQHLLIRIKNSAELWHNLFLLLC